MDRSGKHIAPSSKISNTGRTKGCPFRTINRISAPTLSNDLIYPDVEERALAEAPFSIAPLPNELTVYQVIRELAAPWWDRSGCSFLRIFLVFPR